MANFLYVTILWFIAYKIPLKLFKHQKLLTIVLIGILILQLLVFTPLWANYGGATRRLDIPWLPSIQPVEFFKLWYIIFMAWWLVRKQHLLNSTTILKKFFFLHLLLFFMFVLMPDIWSTILMGATGFMMALYAGINIKNMLRMVWIGAIVMAVSFGGLISITNSVCNNNNTENNPGICRYSYLSRRIQVYLNPSSDSTGRNISRQNRQAIIAIWGWGFRGRWYGKWLQKFGYIPEAQSDFIFAAFAEEVGFIGIMILLWLYGALAYYILIKVPILKDPFFRNISVGIISMIIIQAFIHIGVNLHILPNTGMTLPFVSYGGTGLMVNILSMILLYRILYQEGHKL